MKLLNIKILSLIFLRSVLYSNYVITFTICLITLELTAQPCIINCPADIDLSLDPGACEAIVGYSVNVTGNGCSGPTQTSGLPSGSSFPVGTTTNCFEATNQYGSSTCCFDVTVSEYPNPVTTLACNDNVQVSVDENYEAFVETDMILEGGPYGCYDDYLVTVQAFGSGFGGVWIDHNALGLTLSVTVTDPTTGNECSGTISIDGIFPVNTPENAIQQDGNQALIADPIQLGTGTYSYSHDDFSMPSINGSLKFTRFYNSLNSNLSGPLGYGWSHTYNYFLTNRQDTAWDVHYPDGHQSTFIPLDTSGQSFPIFSSSTDSLHKNSNTSYSLYTKEKVEYRFDSLGKLDSIIDLNGNKTKLFYTGSKLDSVLAAGGRSLVMTYDSNKLVSVIDPLNRICSYSYDADSNLIRVVGANIDTTAFTYDSLHRMIAIINPLGDTILTNVYDSTGKVIAQEDVYHNVTSIAYDFPNIGDAAVTHPDSSQMVVHHDVFFRKTSEIDELNFTKAYIYDNNSNETGFTNENNHTETRLFDEIGNLLSDTLPGGQITNVTYNNFNSPVQITDANGNVKIFYRDSVNNNLDSILNPDGSFLIFTYDSLGLVTQSVDGNGNISSYLYSTTGDLLSIQTATGIKQFTYDAAGRKISSTDENGHITTFLYDNKDNLLLTTDALGRTIQNTYDANNQLLSSVDKNGYETTYSYDGKGRKISSTDPKGGFTTYTYDVRDRLVSVTDPENNTMYYTYDAKGRKISSTNALGTTQYQYDAVGNLLKVIDPTERNIDYTYTPTNKKQSQIDGLSNTTSFTYDFNDNLISVTDPLDRATAYGYDTKNRLISVTDASNNTTTISYDFNDNKIAVTDPLGHIQAYTYDAANRLVSYDDASGNNYTYSYDSVGNNLILTKPTGTITKVYDAANRVITTGNSTGDNYSYTYDNNDNVLTMSNSVGTSTMTYDSLDQLIQYLDPHGNLVSFNYDSAGNKTSIIYPGNKIVAYTYDGANNLTSLTDWLNQTFIYTYDSTGRTSQLTYPNGITCQYGYDNAGRLDKKITRLSTGQIISGSTLSLDAVGNRVSEQRLAQVPSMLPSISRVYDYANDDSMTSDSVWNYTNDNSGNRIAETDGTNTATYSFSADNLLNSRMDTTGANMAYTYNPLGHRISKAIGTDVIEYVLDISSSLSQVLQITDSNGVVQSSYVYGHGLLERIDTADIALFYHFDAQHNTVLLTDQDTILKDVYTYDPFGAIISHSGATTQPFTFLGEYGVEQESPGQYYARARYYDAINGRFISKDAFDYDLNNPQTINRYIYGLNNPSLNYDPSGLFSWTSAGIASLQLASGFGNLASGALSFYGSAALGSILGPGAVLSGGSSLNDATKDFQAFNANLNNAFNSNDNWVSSDNFAGALDFVYNDPTISAIQKGYAITFGLMSLTDLLRESPKDIAGILTSNYSTTQIKSFLTHYFIGQNSPVLKLNDIGEMIRTVFEGYQALSLSNNTLTTNQKCK